MFLSMLYHPVNCVVYCVRMFVRTRTFHVFASAGSDVRIRCSPALKTLGFFLCFCSLRLRLLLNYNSIFELLLNNNSIFERTFHHYQW